MTMFPDTAVSRAPPAIDINVTALRQALRLVHCLQKERGASCSYHASKSLFNKRLTVDPARRDTDRALRSKACGVMYGNSSNNGSSSMNSYHQARTILEKIRKATESEGVSYHRILATYNCLISAIVHDGIYKHTNSVVKSYVNQNTSINMNDTDADADSTVKRGNNNQYNNNNAGLSSRQRLPSFHNVTELVAASSQKQQQAQNQPQPPQHRRMQSDNFRSRLATDPTDYSFLWNTTTPTTTTTTDAATGQKKQHLARIDSIGSEPTDDDNNNSSNDNDDKEDESTVDSSPNLLPQLLSLLETFVALTESIGVERATLCSILAAGPESHYLLNVSGQACLPKDTLEKNISQFHSFGGLLF